MTKRSLSIFVIVLYVIGALVSFGLNDFSTERSVRRHPEGWCEQQQEKYADTGMVACLETTEIRYGFHHLWISWVFTSDGKGDNVADYTFFDLVTLLVVVGLHQGYRAIRKRGPK